MSRCEQRLTVWVAYGVLDRTQCRCRLECFILFLRRPSFAFDSGHFLFVNWAPGTVICRQKSFAKCSRRNHQVFYFHRELLAGGGCPKPTATGGKAQIDGHQWHRSQNREFHPSSSCSNGIGTSKGCAPWRNRPIPGRRSDSQPDYRILPRL